MIPKHPDNVWFREGQAGYYYLPAVFRDAIWDHMVDGVLAHSLTRDNCLQSLPDLQISILNVRRGGYTGHPRKLFGYFQQSAGSRPGLAAPWQDMEACNAANNDLSERKRRPEAR